MRVALMILLGLVIGIIGTVNVMNALNARNPMPDAVMQAHDGLPRGRTESRAQGEPVRGDEDPAPPGPARIHRQRHHAGVRHGRQGRAATTSTADENRAQDVIPAKAGMVVRLTVGRHGA
ncbi:hypothetical protein [Rhodanobacter lindaniclasticus]